MSDERILAAQRALAGHGIFGATVEIEGHQREIAAVRVPAAAWERALGADGARAADAVKAAGFRYVALDLAPAEDHA